MNEESFVSLRFGENAENYAKSKIHSVGKTLEMLNSVLKDENNLCVVDIGCATGNCSKSIIDKSVEVIGVDPSHKMLQKAEENFKFSNVKFTTIKAYAENLPIEDNYADLTVSRIAAHHYAVINKAFNEMIRVTKSGGHICLIDLSGFEDTELSTINHVIELLHDPTHIKSYTLKSWKRKFNEKNIELILAEDVIHEIEQKITTDQWCKIAKSGEDALAAINKVLDVIPQKMMNQLGIYEASNGYERYISTFFIFGKKK